MRKDRDDYVDVRYDNIRKGEFSQFNICKNCDLQGLEYDVGSIMHYGPYAFSSNGEPTIVPKNGDLWSIGQRSGFSELDIKGINKLYCNGEDEIQSNSNCEDVFPQECPWWNDEGHCSKDSANYDWLTQNCKKSCGYCEL